jgi:TRAP-type C4-dicarboxylate transport system permease small subunit
MENSLILLSKTPSSDAVSVQFLIGLLVVVVGTILVWYLWEKFSKFAATWLAAIGISILVYLAGYHIGKQVFFIWSMSLAMWMVMVIIHLFTRNKRREG